MPDIIAIGVQDFEKIRQNKTMYVDKTYFIKDWWEHADDVTLITRPRRFGKTLNMSMLEYFFANYHAGRGDLFEGLSVWEDEEYRDLQGTYPVIAVSFAGVKSNNYKDAKMQIFTLIDQLWNKYPMLEKDSYIMNEKKMIDKCVAEGLAVDIDEVMLSMSLNKLSKRLYDYYGKKVLIFMDEYDTPMQEAWLSGFWDEIVSLFRNMLNNTFKTNPSLYRAVITGITRVSEESLSSGLNNLTVVTTTSDMYATAFGFTENEVFDALDNQELSDQKDSVEKWYDGFKFGNVDHIYNPWSISSFLSEKRIGTYWANTSSNGLVSSLIREGGGDVKEIMEDLLHDIPLITEINEQIIFNQLNGNAAAICSLLLASGYLKVVNYEFDVDARENRYELVLTNLEVRLMFEKMISEWFDESDGAYNDFIKALLANDLEAMNYYMNKVVLSTFSSFDTGGHPSGQSEPERFYHGFVLGLLVDLKKEYSILSNRESGFGRYDVMLEPLKENLPAIVMEFKVFNENREKSLEDTVKAALAQIEDKKYDRTFLDRGIAPERIFHYGFAFEGKKVLIG